MTDLVEVSQSSATNTNKHSQSDSLGTSQVTESARQQVQEHKWKRTKWNPAAGRNDESLFDKSLILLGLMLEQVAVVLKDNQNLCLLAIE